MPIMVMLTVEMAMPEWPTHLRSTKYTLDRHLQDPSRNQAVGLEELSDEAIEALVADFRDHVSKLKAATAAKRSTF